MYKPNVSGDLVFTIKEMNNDCVVFEYGKINQYDRMLFSMNRQLWDMTKPTELEFNFKGLF